ncbi:uncharacterized protein, partial [Mycetomoellerius zeteki]|uniref:uncharacterized protein n=1 Tax=Mycetomoellerius zeteki TaxID=64791 RepID=UPI00084EB265
MAETEAGDSLIPVRCWIREHYTKLTRSNEARCNHCNAIFSIHLKRLVTLHKHLVREHPDKLTEKEKNEVKLHWAWDYYIVKSNTEATCRLCKVTVRYKQVNGFKRHLKRIHEMSGPTSDNVIDNESSSDDDMDANKDITLREATRQDTSSNLTNLSDRLNECTEGIKGLNEEAQNNFVPVRLWMRGHYTKLKRNKETRCIHCNGKFITSITNLSILHKHLIETHPDKLTEEEKNEVRFHWAWDYYIEKSSTEITCKQCKATIRYKKVNDLKEHLKRKHGISGPTSDNVIDNESSSDDDMDANKDITLRKAKRQEASSNSTKLSDNLYECAEGTEAINERTSYNLIPIRRWMREHYTKLTRNRAGCNHCNTKFGIHTTHLYKLHKHLIEAHPDKLTEEEKNEVKLHWAWDYYIEKSSTEITCKQCKTTIRYKKVNDLKEHLKRNHGISGPTSDNVIDNENSSVDDMDAKKDETLRKATRQDTSSNLTNLSDSLNKCMNSSSTLHKHLIETHPDKLTEEEKNEVKFHWAWDYYIVKNSTEATCKQCKRT